MPRDHDGIRAEGPVHVLRAAQALRTGEHFVYASDRHGSAYVHKDLLYAFPGFLRILTDGLSKKIAEEHGSLHEPTPMFLGPAMGGAFVAQQLALAYAEDFVVARVPRDPFDSMPLIMPEVYAAYAEKTPEGGFRIREAFHRCVQEIPVVVTEDVLTTGGSAKKVIEAVDALGGEVAGVATLVNRGNVTAEDLGVPWLCSLISLELESFPADECPLCMAGQPISTDVGHGASFLNALDSV